MEFNFYAKEEKKEIYLWIGTDFVLSFIVPKGFYFGFGMRLSYSIIVPSIIYLLVGMDFFRWGWCPMIGHALQDSAQE